MPTLVELPEAVARIAASFLDFASHTRFSTACRVAWRLCAHRASCPSVVEVAHPEAFRSQALWGRVATGVLAPARLVIHSEARMWAADVERLVGASHLATRLRHLKVHVRVVASDLQQRYSTKMFGQLTALRSLHVSFCPADRLEVAEGDLSTCADLRRVYIRGMTFAEARRLPLGIRDLSMNPDSVDTAARAWPRYCAPRASALTHLRFWNTIPSRYVASKVVQRLPHLQLLSIVVNSHTPPSTLAHLTRLHTLCLGSGAHSVYRFDAADAAALAPLTNLTRLALPRSTSDAALQTLARRLRARLVHLNLSGTSVARIACIGAPGLGTPGLDARAGANTAGGTRDAARTDTGARSSAPGSVRTSAHAADAAQAQAPDAHAAGPARAADAEVCAWAATLEHLNLSFCRHLEAATLPGLPRLARLDLVGTVFVATDAAQTHEIARRRYPRAQCRMYAHTPRMHVCRAGCDNGDNGDTDDDCDDNDTFAK